MVSDDSSCPVTTLFTIILCTCTLRERSQAHTEKENWLKFYVNPYSGMAEAEVTEPVPLNQANLEVRAKAKRVRIFVVDCSHRVRRCSSAAVDFYVKGGTPATLGK